MSDLLLKQVVELLEGATDDHIDRLYSKVEARELVERIKEALQVPGQLNTQVTVRDLVAALRYNTEYEGWTKEAILKQVEWIHRPLTGGEVSTRMYYAKRELEQARKVTVAALNERNKEYGRLSAKFQELKEALRKTNREKRELELKLAEINKTALHGKNISTDIQKIVELSKV